MVKSERVIITVIGKDRIGIVAGISSVLSENGANIIDLTSTQMHELFVMVILAELNLEKISIELLQAELNKKAKELDVQVLAQHEDIFKFMHRI
ncbi:MAG: ACT domain-containing protein [Conexivisphaerales archaeon]